MTSPASLFFFFAPPATLIHSSFFLTLTFSSWPFHPLLFVSSFISSYVLPSLPSTLPSVSSLYLFPFIFLPPSLVPPLLFFSSILAHLPLISPSPLLLPPAWFLPSALSSSPDTPTFTTTVATSSSSSSSSSCTARHDVGPDQGTVLPGVTGIESDALECNSSRAP